ncbi:hypothetical protein JCM17960_25470 [Magnetospira thiophila]
MGDDGQWYGLDGNKIDNPNRDPNVQNAQAVVPLPGPLPVPVPPQMIPGHEERTRQLNALGNKAIEQLQRKRHFDPTYFFQ